MISYVYGVMEEQQLIRVAELNNLSKTEVMNQVLEDERDPRTRMHGMLENQKQKNLKIMLLHDPSLWNGQWNENE